MIITLYENCRLTKAYNEVFKSTYLEGYLNTLTKYTYTLEEGDEVYLTNKGRCNLEAITQGDLKCNYMKVEDDVNHITRYFFIDDYDIVNGVAVVDYTEDVWATYSSKINIVKGDVSNLRYGIGNNPKFLPNDYITNDKLVLNPLYINQNNRLEYLIMEISFYDLVEGGKVNDRYNYVFTCMTPSNQGDNIRTYGISDSFNVLDEINQLSSFPEKLVYNATEHKYSFEIVNAYIVPKEYYDLLNFRTSSLRSFTIDGYVDLAIIQSDLYSYSFTRDNNYKRYAIGTLDNFIVTDENGSSVKCELMSTCDNVRFRLLLKVASNIIDITTSFNYEFVVSVQSADVTQQQAISRELRNQTLDIQKNETIAKGINNIIGDMSKLVIGTGMVVSGTGALKGASMMVENSTSGINTGIDMAYSLEKNSLNKWYVNYKSYKSNSSVNTRRNIYINLLYGIIDFTILPDNENYINALIEVIGYKTMKIETDNTLLTTPQESKDYNIIKFNSVWMYGNFPHTIQLILEEILTKGFKIWFKSNV